MSSRLTLVSHSSTSATAGARFADDEPLDDRGATRVADARDALVRELGRVERVLCAPAPACHQTATALLPGRELRTEPRLRDWDAGHWRGRRLDDVAAEDPAGLHAWMSDPAAAPHGGESLAALFDRVGTWLASVPPEGHTVAITHAAVVRAAVAVTVHAPPAGFWRIDVPPLAATALRGGPDRWTLRLGRRRD